MGLFTREMFANPDDDAGVFMLQLGQALVTWTAMQMQVDGGRHMTVQDAAMAFNTTTEVICEAIDGAMWIYLTGDVIGLDGE